MKLCLYLKIRTYFFSDGSSEEQSPPGKKAAVKKFFGKLKPKTKKGWIFLVIIILIIAGVVYGVTRHGGDTKSADDGYITDTVQYRDINSSITGSGTLEAANQYSVKSLVGGTILSDTFEEGDTVAQDTVLYNIDSSDSANSLEQAQLTEKHRQEMADQTPAQDQTQPQALTAQRQRSAARRVQRRMQILPDGRYDGQSRRPYIV